MKEIMIDGTPIPIHFGMGAIREFSQHGERSFEGVLAGDFDDNLDALLELIQIGLNYGADRKGQDKRYTLKEVEYLIDDHPSILSEVLLIFNESVKCLTDNLGNLSKLNLEGNVQRPKTSRPRAPKTNR